MFVELKTFYSEIEAQILVTLLNDRNIESIIAKDDAGGMHPHLQAITGVKVLVKEKDFDIAKSILEKTNDNLPTCRKGDMHNLLFPIKDLL